MAREDSYGQTSLDLFKDLANPPVVASKPKQSSQQTLALTFFDNEMTTMEMDIFLYLINQLSTGKDLKHYSISNIVYDLPITYIWPGRKGLNYVRLKDACVNLSKRKITVVSEDSGKGVIVTLFPFIHWDSSKGAIRIEINRRLQEYFMELTYGYSDYLFHETKMFKRHHAKKLYILLGAYYKRTYPKLRLRLDVLSRTLGIPGYDNRLKQYEELYIKPTVELINKDSEIMRVKYEFEQEAVTGYWYIVFYPGIKDKAIKRISSPIDLSGMDDNQLRCFAKLKEYNVEDKIAEDIARYRPKEFSKWLYANKLKFYAPGPKGIKNPGAVIVTHFGYTHQEKEASN